MKKRSEIICFIPARSGSTRVKNKNIRLINERPLIYWTVLKALKSKKFDRIIFSSDSDKYFAILIKYLKKDKLNYKKIIFDKRDPNHSKTKSKIFDYIKFDLIKKFDLNKKDLLVQMLPTCPLKSVSTIKKAIDFSIMNNKNCFSACEYDFHITFGLSIKNNKWKPVFKNSPMITGKTQSQSQNKFYHPNGIINCLWIQNLLKNPKTIYTDSTPILTSKIESQDIDNEEDFKICESLFNLKT